MTTHRIIGLVTGEQGRFICRRCQCEVIMAAVIDVRDVRAKVWREVSDHRCEPLKNVEVVVNQNPMVKQ